MALNFIELVIIILKLTQKFIELFIKLVKPQVSNRLLAGLDLLVEAGNLGPGSINDDPELVNSELLLLDGCSNAAQ